MALVFPAPPTPTLAVEGGGRFPVRRIYCVGRNYWDHAIEMGDNPEREPPFFFQKPSDAAIDVSAEGSEVPYPPQTEKFHFEAEMVIAVGKCGQDVAVEDGMSFIWGYGVGVDLTRRDLQETAKSMRRPWETGKGFDCSGPCGMLVPAASYPTLEGKGIRLSVNGEEKQKSELTKMIWNPAEIISYLSHYERLEPGDIIFTGTPAGVGPLLVGDVCETICDGLPPCIFRVGEKRGPPLAPPVAA